MVFTCPPAYAPASYTTISCSRCSRCAATSPDTPAPTIAILMVRALQPAHAARRGCDLAIVRFGCASAELRYAVPVVADHCALTRTWGGVRTAYVEQKRR